MFKKWINSKIELYIMTVLSRMYIPLFPNTQQELEYHTKVNALRDFGSWV